VGSVRPCLCVGAEILAVPWDPSLSHYERYVAGWYAPRCWARGQVIREARQLNEALATT